MKREYIDRQRQIRFIKAQFSEHLQQRLGLLEVQAPLLAEVGDGMQDNLSGWEQAVAVKVKAVPDRSFEVVHSLAKWKRHTLARYSFAEGDGIVAQLHALRPDEESLSPIHSVYVDQWDWEKVIAPTQRSAAFLQQTVTDIYAALTQTEQAFCSTFKHAPILPKNLCFIHAESLRARYPEWTAKQREQAITEQYGAVFIMGIGGRLSDGQSHDVRAPDYDDWSSIDEQGQMGLNGDLLVWHPGLARAIELSSMGIRVDAEALRRQLKETQQEQRAQLPWHQSLLAGQLPLTIGGGIGQSRVVMQLLQATHIGQVQCGVWDKAVVEAL